MPRRKNSLAIGGRRKLRLLYLFAMFGIFCRVLILRENPLVSIGTIIRGNEWSGDITDSKMAVLNALRSYAAEVGASRLIILVDLESSCFSRPVFLKNAQCHSIQPCIDLGAGVTIDCVFRTLVALSKTQNVAFINGDVMLFQGFVESVKLISRNYENFFLVGRRHMGDGPPKLETNNILASLDTIKEHTLTLPLDSSYAIDFFVARRSDMDDILLGFPPLHSWSLALG